MMNWTDWFFRLEMAMLASVAIGMALCVMAGYILYRISRLTLHKWHLKEARRIWKVIQSIQGENMQPRALSYLRKVNPYVFEELVLLGFKHKGLKVIRNPRYSNDGGMDGIVVENGKRIPVQSKRYTGHIKREHVEAFSLLVDRKKVPYGYFVHTGKTGQGSNTFQFPNIRFISGDKLINHLKEK